MSQHEQCGLRAYFSCTHVYMQGYNVLNMPRLNNDNRNRILGLLDAGMSQVDVARRFHVARSTVVRLLRRYRQTGSVSDRRRTGSPRVTSRRQDVYIRQRHLRNRFLTAQSTAVIVVGNRGRQIHRRTVSRRLREHQIRCRRPYRGAAFTERHRRLRRQWANNHNGRFNWQRVVFSDESRFNLFHTDGRSRVYRRRGERFVDNTVLQRDRFGGGSVMVWGAINYGFRSRLIVVDGNLNARRYIDEILTPEVIPLLRRQRQQLTFQQDNARPHTARITMDYLRQNNVDVLDWPSLSPDLSPIEHIWDELGRRVRQRQPAPRTLIQLTTALREEWDNIPRGTVRRLCQSMPSRIRECIRHNGGHMRY